MTNIKDLKTFLQQMVLLRSQGSAYDPNFKYICYEDLLLQRGTEYVIQPLPDYIELGIEKHCYYNCQQLVWEHKNLTYVEGYAVHSRVPFPVFHAWVVDDQGYAYEPTWECEGEAYLGISFSRQWLKAFMKARKRRGQGDDLAVIESNYLERYSLLRDEIYVKP